MKKRRLIFICSLFIIMSCSNDDESQPLPECLRPIVDVLLEQDIQNPRANIEKWLYDSQKVYLVNGQNFPDGQSHVITLNCEDICTLRGLDGPMNDCPNWDEAEYIKTIWTDSR